MGPCTGETFFTTQGRAQPIAIELTHAAPGFREALPLLHAGEKAVVWMPPRAGTMEPVAYEIELVEVLASRPAAPVAPRSWRAGTAWG